MQPLVYWLVVRTIAAHKAPGFHFFVAPFTWFTFIVIIIIVVVPLFKPIYLVLNRSEDVIKAMGLFFFFFSLLQYE